MAESCDKTERLVLRGSEFPTPGSRGWLSIKDMVGVERDEGIGEIQTWV